MTERCLKALESTEALGIARVLVVNDASDDDTLLQLRRFPWVSVLSLSENVGFPGACNAGVATVKTEFTVLLNNDTEPLPNFLQTMLNRADQDRDIAIVGSRLVYPDGRLQEAGGIVWADATASNYGRGASPDDPSYLYVRDVDYCSAASILIRTAFWREVGGFDPRFTRGYYEDTDLAFAAHSLSRRVVYEPSSVVIHLEGGSHGTDPTKGIKRLQEPNRALFRAKWLQQLERQWVPGIVPPRISASRGGRRSLLFIDHAIPRPNHDSGSRRSDAIVQTCRDLGYRTVFAAQGRDPFSPEAASLRDNGTMVLTTRDEIRQFIASERDWLACVFLARPGVASQWQPWIASRHPDVPVVFDTVDLHHIREMGGAMLAGSKRARLRARWTKTVEFRLVQRCAATIVVSETERQYLAERIPNARVFTVGNIHSLGRPGPPFARRKGLLFVGTFLHEPNRDGIEWFVTSVWPLIADDIREDGLVVIGDDPPDALKNAAPPHVVFRGWVRDIEPDLERARLSIAPLRFGAGVKGKVGEAWSYGLPVVGTPVALEGMAETGNAACLAADRPAEFARMIERVYRDEDEWLAASRAGRALVEERFAPELASETLRALLEQVAHRPAPQQN